MNHGGRLYEKLDFKGDERREQADADLKMPYQSSGRRTRSATRPKSQAPAPSPNKKDATTDPMARPDEPQACAKRLNQMT